MDEVLLVRGLNGRRRLRGAIPVRGAKNAALKALAASLLFRDRVRVRNVPSIEDIARVVGLLEGLGVRIETRGSSYRLTPPVRSSGVLKQDIAKRLRASIVLSGPVLARFGKVVFPHPGGCLIGERPIDLFLEGFQKMGAEVRERGDTFAVTAPRKGLVGAEMFFRHKSVTATETLMMAAVRARGTTVLRNAALEPEVETLAKFLNESGARIRGAGTSTIAIRGTGLLQSRGRAYRTPPDRIEAGSFLILGALGANDITIERCEPRHMEALIETLSFAGVPVEVGRNSVRVRPREKPSRYRAVNVQTHEYPGFPTDLQAPMAVFLTQAAGKALLFETIFENRFGYIDELVRMGADIHLSDPHRIIVTGPTPLSGRTLKSPDLRAGLAYVIAALVAGGTSVIHNIYNIDRGYERIEERLQGIGADIARSKG